MSAKQDELIAVLGDLCAEEGIGEAVRAWVLGHLGEMRIAGLWAYDKATSTYTRSLLGGPGVAWVEARSDGRWRWIVAPGEGARLTRHEAEAHLATLAADRVLSEAGVLLVGAGMPDQGTHQAPGPTGKTRLTDDSAEALRYAVASMEGDPGHAPPSPDWLAAWRTRGGS